jgi:hypothetical protein
MRTRALLIVVAAMAGWFPSAALAAGGSSTAAAGYSTATAGGASTPVTIPGSTSPFAPPGPLTPQQTPTATAPIVVNPAVTSSSAGGGVNATDAILIGIGAVLILVGIAYFIWADSRRHARLRPGEVTVASGGRTGSKPPQKPRKLSAAERRRRKRGRAR